MGIRDLIKKERKPCTECSNLKDEVLRIFDTDDDEMIKHLRFETLLWRRAEHWYDAAHPWTYARGSFPTDANTFLLEGTEWDPREDPDFYSTLRERAGDAYVREMLLDCR